MVKRSEESTTDGRKEVREEVKVRVIRAGDTPRGQTEAHAFSFSKGQNLGHAIGESIRFGPIGMSFQDSKLSSTSTITELGATASTSARPRPKRDSRSSDGSAVSD